MDKTTQLETDNLRSELADIMRRRKETCGSTMTNYQHQGITAVAFSALDVLRDPCNENLEKLFRRMASYTADIDGAWDVWLDVFKDERMLDVLKQEQEFYEWFNERRETEAREAATKSLETLRENDSEPMHHQIALTAFSHIDNGMGHVWEEVFSGVDLLPWEDEHGSNKLATETSG